MYAEILAAAHDVETGASRDDLLSLLPPGGARNAIDCALWDLECQLQKKTIWELTKIKPGSISTVMTIGIGETPEAMAAAALRYAEYPVLKVKLDDKLPVERITAIRTARPDATILIDANQGFTFDLLQEVAPEFAALNVSMLEQPLARGADENLAGFDAPVPLCADESCMHLGELDEAASRYQMINIKLDKTGGLTEALNLAARAQELGLSLMVGNMFGSSLAMAPSLVIAQLCQFVDLDGPLLLRHDRPNGLRYENDMVTTPGNGIWGGL